MKFSRELEIKVLAGAIPAAVRFLPQLIIAVMLLTCLPGGQKPAFGSPAFALPEGVATLENLAGEWKMREELAQYPSIHNFKAELLVNKDLTSVSWVASPPFSQG